MINNNMIIFFLKLKNGVPVQKNRRKNNIIFSQYAILSY